MLGEAGFDARWPVIEVALDQCVEEETSLRLVFEGRGEPCEKGLGFGATRGDATQDADGAAVDVALRRQEAREQVWKCLGHEGPRGLALFIHELERFDHAREGVHGLLAQR